jgi:hypothetical protein
MTGTTRERYALEVTGLPGWSTPTAQRLGLLLRAARRQFGLRCTAVGEIKPAGTAVRGTTIQNSSPKKAIENQPNT